VLPQFRPVSFFFDQIFRELEPHHYLAELRLHPAQLAVLWIDPMTAAAD